MTQGDVDSVSVEARFESEAEAAQAAAARSDTGHPWSGLTAYRVLRCPRRGVFLAPDGSPYWPKAEYGF